MCAGPLHPDSVAGWIINTSCFIGQLVLAGFWAVICLVVLAVLAVLAVQVELPETLQEAISTEGG